MRVEGVDLSIWIVGKVKRLKYLGMSILCGGFSTFDISGCCFQD